MQQAMQTLQRNGIMPAAPGLLSTYPTPGASANLYGQPPVGGGLDFSSLFGGNPPLTSAPPVVSPVDPAARFANQIQQLHAMGFNDDAANIRALLATNGNVSAAVERLLGA